MRAAGAGRDAVDVTAQVLVGRLRPLQHELEPRTTLVPRPLQRERRIVHRRRLALGDDLLQIVDESFAVLEGLPFLLGLVLKDELDALVQVARRLQPLADD